MKQFKKSILSHKAVQPLLQLAGLTSDCSLSAHAGQTAFFFMLSFFPFMLFLFAILRVTPLTEELLSAFILYMIPDSFHDFMSSLIHNIYTASSKQVLSLSVISAIWLGSKAFLSLIQGLNAVYRQKESRNYIMLRIFAFLDSILFALLLLATLALLVFGNWIHTFIMHYFPLISSTIGQFINFRMLIGAFALFIIFLFLYYYMPNCKWKLHHHIPGACLTTTGWLLFSCLYSFYVDNFSNYSSFYGTMSTIALLMVWLYACMYMLFLGGLLNACLKKYTDHRASVRKHEV